MRDTKATLSPLVTPIPLRALLSRLTRSKKSLQFHRLFPSITAALCGITEAIRSRKLNGVNGSYHALGALLTMTPAPLSAGSQLPIRSSPNSNALVEAATLANRCRNGLRTSQVRGHGCEIEQNRVSASRCAPRSPQGIPASLYALRTARNLNRSYPRG